MISNNKILKLLTTFSQKACDLSDKNVMDVSDLVFPNSEKPSFFSIIPEYENTESLPCFDLSFVIKVLSEYFNYGVNSFLEILYNPPALYHYLVYASYLRENKHEK